MRSLGSLKHERELDNLGRMPTQKGGAFWSSINDYGYGNYQTESGVSSGVLGYLMYILGFIIVAIAVLVVVHFTITPIFKTRPGEQGYIALPGSDDSKLYWPVLKAPLDTIDERQEGLGLPPYNYTYMLDINIDSPMMNPYPGKPRIIFARSNELPNYELPYTNGSSIRNLFPSTATVNTVAYLDAFTNDLNLTVFTVPLKEGDNPSPISIQLPNVPIRTAFRLAVVVSERFMEAYINGNLVKTVTFSTDPITLENGKLSPPSVDLMNNAIRALNLRLWGRPLTPAEIRSYGGNLPKFEQGPMLGPLTVTDTTSGTAPSQCSS
jgi:hypothetical protein